MRASIDTHHQTVTIRNRGKTEVLNLVYEPETWKESDNELKTEFESGMWEDSHTWYYSAFVLTLKEERPPIVEVEKIDVSQEKISHLPEEYAEDIG